MSVWLWCKLNHVPTAPGTVGTEPPMVPDYHGGGSRTPPDARVGRRARGSGSACKSDGDDSDGQGAPQGGGGVQSTPVSARAAEILRGLRGLEAIFMRK